MKTNGLFSSFMMLIWMTFVTGIAYPLLITLTAQIFMKESADGAFVKVNDQIVGAHLIAQPFTSDAYFWPRPSAVDYHTLPSGASNLGPTSIALQKVVTQRRGFFGVMEPTQKVPNDLLHSSASGLDPHISIDAAYFQMLRIIQARGWNREEGKQKLTTLIKEMTEERRYVNVLMLNIALDNMNNHSEGL